MTITDKSSKYSGRQYPLCLVIDFTYADFTVGTQYRVGRLPGGAVITSAAILTKTVFNNTTPIATLGLESEGASPLSIFNGVSLAAVEGFSASLYSQSDEGNLDEALCAIAATGDALILTIGTSGTPTAGRAVLIVEYVMPGREQENKG